MANHRRLKQGAAMQNEMCVEVCTPEESKRVQTIAFTYDFGWRPEKKQEVYYYASVDSLYFHPKTMEITFSRSGYPRETGIPILSAATQMPAIIDWFESTIKETKMPVNIKTDGGCIISLAFISGSSFLNGKPRITADGNNAHAQLDYDLLIEKLNEVKELGAEKKLNWVVRAVDFEEEFKGDRIVLRVGKTVSAPYTFEKNDIPLIRDLCNEFLKKHPA